jgi:FkbM family methyltransferase
MRVNLPNVLYAVAHPARAIRYLRFRDVIPYAKIAPHIPPNPVIIEAGAHDGTNTAEMATCWPGAVIHAFEPVPEAAASVARRIAPFGQRVRCHACGLGPFDGETEMHLSGQGSAGDCQSSSILPPTEKQLREFPDVHFSLVKKVPMRRLDSWAATEGVDRVDFMWLDMQGYELQALAGATQTLRTTSAVHMEVSNVRLYEGAPLYQEVRERMASWGFSPAIEAFFRVSGNVLFVRR